MNIFELKQIIREIVSTEFSNDGQGGIESQTGSDLMGYWHGDGPIHQGPQPAEGGSKHIFFDSGGGKEQSDEQSSAASQSGAKEQVATGIEESNDVIDNEDGLLEYVKKYQKLAKNMNSKNFILTKMHKVTEEVTPDGKYSFKIKSGNYNSKPVELLVRATLKGLSYSAAGIKPYPEDLEISIFLDDNFIQKIENPQNFLFKDLS